jgi:hypothetical protein
MNRIKVSYFKLVHATLSNPQLELGKVSQNYYFHGIIFRNYLISDLKGTATPTLSLAKIDLFLNRALLGEKLQTVFNKLKKQNKAKS